MGKIIDSPDLMETGERLRLARQRAGYTQEALADAMGVSWNTIHRMEYAQAAMGIDKLFLIADILHIGVQELCPSRFDTVRSLTLSPEYRRLNEKNKGVVIDAMNALINSLLSAQEES